MYLNRPLVSLFSSVISLILFSCSTSVPDYSGTWEDSGEHYENILELTKLDNSDNEYRFSINSWRESYDFLVNDITRFRGGMNDSTFIIKVVDGQAMYTDDGREFEEGWELYNEGEQRCSVMFAITDTSIVLNTEACAYIYGGWGVVFDGVYHKVGDNK